MSHHLTPATTSSSRPIAGIVRRLAAVLAIGAVVALTIHPTIILAADPGAGNAASGEESSPPVVRVARDDGEDHFDEGDDEFDCDEDEDDGDDACVDRWADREVDGDDADQESGCADYDDGEDRCLDDGADRFDEGDDEFDAVCSGPAPCSVRSAAHPTSDPPRATPPSDQLPVNGAVIAGVMALGAGGLLAIRRLRR